MMTFSVTDIKLIFLCSNSFFTTPVDQVLTHLFDQISRPGDSQMTLSISESSCHCYYLSNHSKIDAPLVCALHKDTTSEIAGVFFKLSL